MTMRRRFLKRLGRALPAALLAAAVFGPLSSPGAQAAEQVIRMIPGGDLKILDPIQSPSYITRIRGYMISDSLCSQDSNGEIRPEMVDTHSGSPDGPKYTFRLREGLKCHDGAPVTAADCVASIRRWGARAVSGRLLMA